MGYMGYYDSYWRPYVPVATRRAQAARKMAKLAKKGQKVQPVAIEGRKIAHTFWGQAWCEHLESFSDFANRLPRGRTYVRNGSVCHLGIERGRIDAYVSGSELYTVRIEIESLAKRRWNGVKARCAGQIASLLELLQGKLSQQVMAVVTDRAGGLFPSPREIRLSCSCPDVAVMCKHVAAVFYGVGARLDATPELLFLLRGVDHQELIGAPAEAAAIATDGRFGRKRIAEVALPEVFGIEMAETEAPAQRQPRRKLEPRGPAPAARRGPGAVTGQAVAALRAKFGLSQAEFAKLLGVSAATVGNWERAEEALRLQARTQQAWEAARDWTKRSARARLS